MKTFWKILAGIIIVIIILLIALNLYYTDERLKQTVMPYLTDAIERPVEIEQMSLSFFTTFPQPGLEMENLVIFGETKNDTLLSLGRLVIGVELFSLLGDEIQISELVFENPRFTYIVFADSSTNLDFLFDEEADTTQTKSQAINIPYFEVSNGFFGYHDFTSNTVISLNDVDGDLSLRYADVIETQADLEIGGFSTVVDGATYMDNMPLALSQKSDFYAEKEILQLEESSLSIRGLELDLSGKVSDWSDTAAIDLQLASTSDDFGALLKLAPENYADYTEDLTTQGSLTLKGSVAGKIAENTTPSFDFIINVKNGYLKDPDLPDPVENITIDARATNQAITVQSLNAEAGSNYITGSGKLLHPLENSRSFNADFVANVDLSTLHNFYDLSQMNIEQLGGQLDVDATAEGNLGQPDDIQFEGHAVLADGMLQYEDVSEPISNINIEARGNHDQLTIESLQAQAAQNSFSANGQIQNLLNENARSITMNTSLRFDLSTLSQFYPIDEDTLKLDGLLTAQATLSGSARQIEEAVESGTVELQGGMIDYHKLNTPLRNITLVSVLKGDQMVITEGNITGGESSISLEGVINDYLSENRSVQLKTEGNLNLSQITEFYELAPNITQLSGNADFNFTVQGSFDEPAELAFSGRMEVSNAAMQGEALAEPVENIQGTFLLAPDKAALDTLSFKIGSSDIHVSGSLADYMQYLKSEDEQTATPALSGRFYSNYLNVDELVDWSDTTEGNFTLDLPDLNSTVQAQIDRMMVFGVTMRNISGLISTTPSRINLNKAYAEFFEGIAKGNLIWQIPGEAPSTLSFSGALEAIRVGAFFEQYPVLGSDSHLHEFISGTFSSQADYQTKISAELSPLIPTTEMTATFGMNQARINNHPLQEKLAGFLKIPEINNAVIDNWKSALSIENSVLHVNNLSITSDDIGLEINGTQHLVSDEISFNVSVALPERFKQTVASVITAQAANALTQDNGTLQIPLIVTGTYQNIQIRPDQRVIKPLIQNFLKNKAGNVLQNLFGGDEEEAVQTDTTVADTTGN